MGFSGVTSISKLEFDRSNPEQAQVRAHNSRIRLRYPEIWKISTITNKSLHEWVLAQPKDCPYKGLNPGCNGIAKEIDHRVPLSREGALHTLENLQLICEPCNRSKHDQTEEEFLKSLESQEVKKSIPSKLSLADYGISKADLKDSIGRFRTVSLFKEMGHQTQSDDYPCFFSLKLEEDSDKYISVYRVYMTYQDPTEYKIAVNLFGGIRHWKLLCDQSWFKVYLHRWRKELKARLRAYATEKILNIADSSSNGALQALRVVLQEDTIFKSFLDDDIPTVKAGRPKKEKEVLEIPNDTLKDDMARIGLER
jgi:hypothetical protein